MKKYATIVINTKMEEKRCVLINYKKEKCTNRRGRDDCIDFLETRIIDIDDYFKDKNKSHQYVFEDDGYILVSDNAHEKNDLIGVKRPYHYYKKATFCKPDKFVARSDYEAKRRFNNG